MKGIDVSSYQGKIDWKKVKNAGCEFSILKIIRKDLNPDTRFEENYKGCIEAGIPVYGVYNYSYATTTTKAKQDAAKVLQILNGRKLKVWLDVEDSCQKNMKGKLVDIINAYKDVIVSNGLEFGVYTGLSFYNTELKPYIKNVDYSFWIARYPKTSNVAFSSNPSSVYKPSINNNLEGWQYSSSLVINGISGKADVNLWYAVQNSSKFVYDGIDYSRVFDPAWYASHNADIVSALGTNPDDLFNHFIKHGRNEISRAGRTISGFNVEVYKNNNLDLQKTFENNLAKYYRHYCEYGYKENRKIV